MPSLASSPSRRRGQRRPVEPQPDPVGVRAPRRTASRTAARARRRRTSRRAGPARTRSGPGRGGRGVSSGRRLARPARPPAARRRPRPGAGRPRRACRWSASRAPAATAIPPATATYDRTPAPAPERSVAPAGSHSAAPWRARGAVDRDRAGAPVTATQQPASVRSSSPPSSTSSTAASGSLPTSRLASAAAGASSAPARGTPRWARPSRPAVLDRHQRPGVEHVQPRSSRHEPHPGAGRQQRRLVAGLVPQRRRRCGRAAASRPATRSGRPRTSVPASADRAGRHRGPRRLQPGYGELGRQPGQVGEARARTRRTPRRTRSRVCRATTPSTSVPHASATNARSGPSYATGTSTSSPAGVARPRRPARSRAASAAGSATPSKSTVAAAGTTSIAVDARDARPGRQRERRGGVVDLDEDGVAGRPGAACSARGWSRCAGKWVKGPRWYEHQGPLGSTGAVTSGRPDRPPTPPPRHRADAASCLAVWILVPVRSPALRCR